MPALSTLVHALETNQGVRAAWIRKYLTNSAHSGIKYDISPYAENSDKKNVQRFMNRNNKNVIVLSATIPDLL